MIISGILMATRPAHLNAVCERVEEHPWADVQISEPDGRIIATIEADDIEQSMSRLRQLQALPDVIMAELAQYYIEEDEEQTAHSSLND